MISGFDAEDEAVTKANPQTTVWRRISTPVTSTARCGVSGALRVGDGRCQPGVISDPAAPRRRETIRPGSEGGSEGIEEYLNTGHIALTG